MSVLVMIGNCAFIQNIVIGSAPIEKDYIGFEKDNLACEFQSICKGRVLDEQFNGSDPPEIDYENETSSVTIINGIGHVIGGFAGGVFDILGLGSVGQFLFGWLKGVGAKCDAPIKCGGEDIGVHGLGYMRLRIAEYRLLLENVGLDEDIVVHLRRGVAHKDPCDEVTFCRGTFSVVNTTPGFVAVGQSSDVLTIGGCVLYSCGKYGVTEVCIEDLLADLCGACETECTSIRYTFVDLLETAQSFSFANSTIDFLTENINNPARNCAVVIVCGETGEFVWSDIDEIDCMPQPHWPTVPPLCEEVPDDFQNPWKRYLCGWKCYTNRFGSVECKEDYKYSDLPENGNKSNTNLIAKDFKDLSGYITNDEELLDFSLNKFIPLRGDSLTLYTTPLGKVDRGGGRSFVEFRQGAIEDAAFQGESYIKMIKDQAHQKAVGIDSISNTEVKLIWNNKETLMEIAVIATESLVIERLQTNGDYSMILAGKFLGDLSVGASTMTSEQLVPFIIDISEDGIVNRAIKFSNFDDGISYSNVSENIFFCGKINVDNEQPWQWSFPGTLEVVRSVSYNGILDTVDIGVSSTLEVLNVAISKDHAGRTIVLSGSGIIQTDSQILNISEESIVIISVNSDDEIIWSHTFLKEGFDYSNLSFTYNENQELLCVMTFENSVHIDQTKLSSNGSKDIVFIKFSTTGEVSRYEHMGTEGYEVSHEILYDNNILYFGGEIETTEQNVQIGSINFFILVPNEFRRAYISYITVL